MGPVFIKPRCVIALHDCQPQNMNLPQSNVLPAKGSERTVEGQPGQVSGFCLEKGMKLCCLKSHTYSFTWESHKPYQDSDAGYDRFSFVNVLLSRSFSSVFFDTGPRTTAKISDPLVRCLAD